MSELKNLKGGDILNNKLTFIKILVLALLLIFPWVINSSTDFSAPKLDDNSIGLYESNICKYNFSDFITSNLNSNYDIKLDRTSSLDCHSKVNGTGFIDDSYVIYLGTNLNIDFLIQSVFWLILFSLIPTSNTISLKNSKVAIFLSLLLFFLHLKAESSFYELSSKIFSVNLENNFLLFTLLITLYLLLLIFNKVFQERFENILNYFPYVFVMIGTYNSLNLNFFLLCFSFIGIAKTLEIKKLQIGLLAVLLVNRLWISQNLSEILFFDIDKLKGFSSSAYNADSITYWSLTYYFFIIGLVFLIQTTIQNIDLLKLRNNFIISGAMVVFLSVISATGSLQNFLTYYYLGLNKTASKSFEAVSGNAWRGISSSAEGIGEFYAFVLLLTFTIAIYKKRLDLNLIYLVLISVNIYGLYRSNNFASISSLLLLLGVALVVFNVRSLKIKSILFLTLVVLIPYGYYSFSTIPSFEDLSRNLIKESFAVSYMEELNTNEYGQNAIQENRFLEILQSQDTGNNMSTSLRYLVEKYHYSDRNYIPNITTAISAIAYPINRSEKWGIFIGKYDPDFKSLIFGSGVNQLSNYYLKHPTKVNTGLVLPHSAVLSYLIYFGMIGLVIIISVVFYKLIIYKSNILYTIFLIYFLINILKSDSLLYINNFMLFIFILNSNSIFEKAFEKNKYEKQNINE